MAEVGRDLQEEDEIRGERKGGGERGREGGREVVLVRWPTLGGQFKKKISNLQIGLSRV